MTVSIRAHHLLCILTYMGKGYTADFVTCYDKVIKRINDGETLRLIEGPDEICQPMLTETTCHCHNDTVLERDRTAARQIAKVLGRHLAPGDTLVLTREKLALLRTAFAEGAIRSACSGCEWQDLCSRIARKDFRGCHLTPPE